MTPSVRVYSTVTLTDPPPVAEPSPLPPVASAPTASTNWHLPRDAKWRFDLLERGRIVQGETLDVTAKSLDWDGGRPIMGGGRISVGGNEEAEALQKKLLRRRIRPVYTLNGTDYPLGIFRASAAPTSYGKGKLRTHAISIVEDGLVSGKLVGSLTFPATTGVIAAVTAVAGDTPVGIADTTATLRTEMSWKDGTARHEIIDLILASAGFTPLRPNVGGLLTSGPFVPANRRAIVYDFRNDAQGIYKPTFDIDANWLSIPNRVRVVARSSSDAPALIGYATDDNPNSPWSYANRGEWVDASVPDTVDATSQEAVNAIAARELALLQQAAATLNFECAWIPGLVMGAVIGFHNTRHNLSGLWEIVSMSWAGGSIVQITARSVA